MFKKSISKKLYPIDLNLIVSYGTRGLFKKGFNLEIFILNQRFTYLVHKVLTIRYLLRVLSIKEIIM